MIKGNGFDYDAATGRVRLVGTVTAEFDVTVDVDAETRAALDAALARTGGGAEARSDAVADVLGEGERVKRLVGLATSGDADRLDVGGMDWTATDLDYYQTDTEVG